MRIGPLDPAHAADAAALCDRACPFDRVVVDEKLFGVAPKISDMREVGTITPWPLGAWEGAVLVGVACVAGTRVRLIAVEPSARRRGIGSALLAACEQRASDGGIATLRAVDQPGNYLAPGIDERNTGAIAWLERRGWQRAGEPRENLLLAVRDNPRVSIERLEAARAAAVGYEIRRARSDETALLAAVATEFGGAWPFELARALAFDPPGVHVALHDGAYCGFAAHDGNNAGLGWFGPTGTWPAHRGKRLGEVLLLACLVDVARDHALCEVAWIGPRPFYDKVAGIASERRFIPMSRAL
jgi:GNAT superfamily N-acetyltransferase